MPEITIPETALVVETEQLGGEPPEWEDTYIVRVTCGGETVFERRYGEWSEETAHNLEDAKDKALTEFGVKLRVLLDRP